MENAEQFSVSEIIKGSFDFIIHNPIILVHQSLIAFFLLIPSVISDYVEIGKIIPETIDYLFLLEVLILVAVYVFLLLFFTTIIDAMYPLMIKNIMDNKEADVRAAFGTAKKKVLTVLGATILVALTVSVGFILLIIPGLIFLAWYYYTIPAIMIKDLGADAGMSASKDFTKDKKLKTFWLYISPYFFAFLLESAFESAEMTSEMGWIVGFGIDLFLAVWIAVIPAYAYIRYSERAKEFKL